MEEDCGHNRRAVSDGLGVRARIGLGPYRV